MTVRRFWGLLGTCALLAQSPNQPATIRTNVPLVLVPVTVSGTKGEFVEDLKEDDFRLTDDGVTRKIHMDTSDTVLSPVALVVLIQSSGISIPALEKISRVGSLIQPLVTGDRGQAAVFAYDAEVRQLQDFTSDASIIHGAFDRVDARTIKTSRLLDAVVEGVKQLQTRPENYRRVLMILGESRDRGSKTKLAGAVEAAQRAGVAIYAITYSAQASAWTAKTQDNPPLPGGPDYIGAITELGRLGTPNAADIFARTTGGRHLSFARLEGLEKTITQIGEEIHSQYLLSFVPAETRNTGLHRLEVTLPSKPGVTVRARPGYWP